MYLPAGEGDEQVDLKSVTSENKDVTLKLWC